MNPLFAIIFALGALWAILEGWGALRKNKQKGPFYLHQLILLTALAIYFSKLFGLRFTMPTQWMADHWAPWIRSILPVGA